jgi:hypothetical protein
LVQARAPSTTASEDATALGEAAWVKAPAVLQLPYGRSEIDATGPSLLLMIEARSTVQVFVISETEVS